MTGKTTSALNVRAKGSFDAPILGVLPLGVEVEVKSKRGKWGRVSFSGKPGYVCLDFVAVDQDDEPLAKS